jgi:antitoxin component YwqK of YwqJK toxin-antitoxin module
MFGESLMSKQVGALLLFFIISSTSFAAQKKTGREKAGLFGPVETVRLEQSEIREQDGIPVESPRRLESVTTYDEKGNEIELSNYFNGTLQNKRTTAYDYPGNITWTYYNPKGAVMSRTIIKSDDSERTTGIFTYDANDSLTCQQNYVYDQRGNLLESSSSFINNRALSSKTVHTYDDEGRPTATRVYDANGILKQESAHTRAGTKVVTHNKDGSTKKWEANFSDLSFEFDSHGNWTKRSHRRKITESGKITELIEVTYRSITYR